MSSVLHDGRARDSVDNCVTAGQRREIFRFWSRLVEDAGELAQLGMTRHQSVLGHQVSVNSRHQGVLDVRIQPKPCFRLCHARPTS